MIRIFLILFLTCVWTHVLAQVNIIETIAGRDSGGYNGDNIPAVDAELYRPSTLWLDKYQNIYISDAFNQRVRRIDNTTGIITTIAGNGTVGYNSDTIAATAAELYVPQAVCLDTAGNVYIADAGNSRIRMVTVSTGIITTVAGNGIAGSSGDNGPAVSAEINGPGGVYVDVYGNIYITDVANNKIRKVTASTGIITTIAGTGIVGYSGDSGPATAAELNGPGTIFLDNSGNILFSDTWNNVIRKIDISGIITTIAGTGTGAYAGDNGPATSAELNEPWGVYVDNENDIFISDFGNGAIRKIDGTTGIITTVAGTGVQGYSGDGGPATAAELYPDDVFLDNIGNMIIADFGNNRIRKVYKWPLGITTQNLTKVINIHPNPTTGKFVIETKATSNQNSVEIFDVVGNKVYESILKNTHTQIDISEEPAGIYMVQVIDGVDGTRDIVRVVKE